MMYVIRTTWLVVLVVLAAVLVSDPAFGAEGVAAAPGGRSLRVVDLASERDPAVRIAVQAGVGLCNRQSGGSVFARMGGQEEQWIAALGLQPDEVLSARAFLESCLIEFPRCVRYSYAEQQALLPNILTVGAVLGAIPVAEEMGVPCDNVVFDATVEFRDRDTPYLATQYVYAHFVNETTGLAMLNPGYDSGKGRVWDPVLGPDMNPAMIDFVFSEKLFVMYLVNGCIHCTEQRALVDEIVRVNPWPKPIGVYGYANYWLVFGGYLFEAQTLCATSRNMGAIPTMVNNLSFFATRGAPITEAGDLPRNLPEEVDYDPTQTYVALIVGDGDNIGFMLKQRAAWIRARVAACREGEDACPPLTWSISPHLARIAPDVLRWYYAMGKETGKDYFMLPPSGHLYAYPSSLDESTMQDAFVAATEADARLLGTHSTVQWEAFNKWRYAEGVFLPKYAKTDGAIQGVFPVNVPYMFPTGTWKSRQFFKVITGPDGGKAVLFRPREWRGVRGEGSLFTRRFFLSPENMANELGAYPRGTVTGIYMTSDGGLNLDNSVMELVKLLPEHVRLVSSDIAVQLALEASEAMEEE